MSHGAKGRRFETRPILFIKNTLVVYMSPVSPIFLIFGQMFFRSYGFLFIRSSGFIYSVTRLWSLDPVSFDFVFNFVLTHCFHAVGRLSKFALRCANLYRIGPEDNRFD